MSVRAYHLRRLAYRKTQGAVSNPGQPSMTNRKARREEARVNRILEGEAAYLASSPVENYPGSLDPDPPLKCECGQCLPGQDRTCPAIQPSFDPRD